MSFVIVSSEPGPSWVLKKMFVSDVDPKGNQPLLFIGRTDVEAEAPLLWLLDVKR